MAQSVVEVEKRKTVDEGDVIDVDDDPLQPKRLKQGRLPFKILDCKPVNPSPVINNAVKKRKLSGPDSPNSKAKQPKVPDLRNSTEKSKSARFDNDNEVSSSSEAENLPATGSKSRVAKNNLLEKFVRREDEITSTNDAIDLTEDVESEQDENIVALAKSPKNPISKSPALPDKHVSKQKSEDHFARKLIFDKKVEDKDESTNAGEKCDLKHNLPKEEHNGRPSVDVLLDSESDVKCIDLCENNEENGMNADRSVDTSVSDNSFMSEAETSIGDQSNNKTPVSKKILSTSTPGANESSISKTTPTADNTEQKMSSRKKSALQQKLQEERLKEKQIAKEQKEKERLEKKRQREEEKAEKDRARQEEKEKREKERLEKKEQAEREKQEKLQQKEEERRRKQELLNAKEEEKRKKVEEKEEEKKLREEQRLKEEEDKQRQAEKRKAAFTSFFIKPKTVTSTKVDKTADNLFIPFTLKKDMTLAPIKRRVLSTEVKEHLDMVLKENQEMKTNFLMELRQHARKPVRTNRVLRKKVEAEQEVELLVHDEDAVKKSMHAVKLLQFHTDYRPPYYGTWTKKVTGVSPRNPWKKDESGVFDYEVDSDDEWEEEEPGESLSDSNGEEEEGDEEEDDEDGWMVPHGYLSEDEVCEEDEEVTPEALKARQRAKAQAWEMELKAKKMVAPPIHFGCYLLDNPCTDAHYLSILKQFEMICLRRTPLETLISNPEILVLGDKATEKATAKTTPGSKGFRKRALPEEAMPDLIRLVHGNTAGIKKLVREFRLYWRRKVSDTDTSLNDSQVDDDTDVLDKSLLDTSSITTEMAEEGKAAENSVLRAASGADNRNIECTGTEHEVTDMPKKQDDNGVGEDTIDSCVSKRQLEMKIMAVAVREKREGSKKHCWFVNDSILKQYSLDHLPLENSWEFVSGDMTKKTSGMVEKITPSKLAEKKTPNKKLSSKKRTSAAEPDPLVTPLKDKPSIDTDGTPKTRAANTPKTGYEVTPNTEREGTPKATKGKKEASAKKTPKDQPSIMAFAKKATNKLGSAKVGKMNDMEVDVIDVDMEMEYGDNNEHIEKNTGGTEEQKIGGNEVQDSEKGKSEVIEEQMAQVSCVQMTAACEEKCNMEIECVKQDGANCKPGEKVSSTAADVTDADMETEQRKIIPCNRDSLEAGKEQGMQSRDIRMAEVNAAQKAEDSSKQEVLVTEDQSPMMNVDEDCIVLH